MPCYDREVADKATGAPEANEIEITPEMIEAGAEIILADSLAGEYFSPTFARILSEKVLVVSIGLLATG
jgi:hypothetical protein